MSEQAVAAIPLIGGGLEDVNTKGARDKIVRGVMKGESGTVTRARWSKYLSSLTMGLSDRAAAEVAGIRYEVLEGVLRTSDEALAEWTAARLARAKRDWTLEKVETVCEAVASGETLQDACKRVDRTRDQFARLALHDPQVKALYDHARTVRAELMADECLEISDEDKDDLDPTGRGNMAAVNRSKLRIETRQFLMGVYNGKRFNTKTNQQASVEVNVNVNHAERLEAARYRAKHGVTLDAEAVEAEVVLPEEPGGLLTQARDRAFTMRDAVAQADDVPDYLA